MRLADGVAVITGGGRGIGRAIALAYAREGAHLLLVSEVESEVQAVAAEARGLGQKALAMKADVRRSDEMEEMARRAVAELGRLEKAGRIITISSAFGKHGGYGFITIPARTQPGQIALTVISGQPREAISLARERVKPMTPCLEAAYAGIRPQKMKNREGQVVEIPGNELFERYLKRRVPQRRMMDPEEVANVAVFLALPETRGMTGPALNIDGGFLMS